MKGSKKTASGWKSDALFYFWMERERERKRAREGGARERERERDGTQWIQFYNPVSGYYVMNSINGRNARLLLSKIYSMNEYSHFVHSFALTAKLRIKI